MQVVFAILTGALLAAPPLLAQTSSHGHDEEPLPAMADPVVTAGEPAWFLLTESRGQVSAKLGPPALVADFGRGMQSWQYQIGLIDHHEFSHQLVFAGPGRTLASITRNYEEERTVDEFFPEAATEVYHYPDASKPRYSVRLRRLSGGRLLMAMGTSRAGQKTGQLLLMHESWLAVFHPWIAQQMAGVRP
jgi:hypothetical protein